MAHESPKDPRLSVLLFGRRVGKTRFILNLAETHNYVLLISADHGCNEYYLNYEKYRVFVRVYEVWNAFGARRVFYECIDTLASLSNKGAKPYNTWLVIDTLTHLQALLSLYDDTPVEKELYGVFQKAACKCNTVVVCNERADTEGPAFLNTIPWGDPAMWLRVVSGGGKPSLFTVADPYGILKGKYEDLTALRNKAIPLLAR